MNLSSSASSKVTLNASSNELAAAFISHPCQVVLDLDGTLLAHDLSVKPQIQRELVKLVIDAFTLLQRTPPLIATNKTLAELETLGISESILFTENCSVMFFPRQLEAVVSSTFSENIVEHYDQLGMISFGNDLAKNIETASQILTCEFRSRLTAIFGGDDWQVVAATSALDPKHPEVTLQDIQDSFGLDQAAARESADRHGNTAIFIKTSAGHLLPFNLALGKVAQHESALWQQICARGLQLGVAFTPSSKAISVSSAKMVRLETDQGEIYLPPAKGLAIELQRKLSGGRQVFFAGDAANDLPAVERLKPGDLFCQMKSNSEEFVAVLPAAAAKVGCSLYQSTQPAPIGLASLVVAALSRIGATKIDLEAENLRDTIQEKIGQWKE